MTVTSDYKMVKPNSKDVLSCVLTKCGVPFVITDGLLMMPMLPADKLAT